MTIADSGSSGSRSPSSVRHTATRSSASVFGSPTSTIGTPSTPAAVRMPLRTNPAPATFTPTKRAIIRADPTLVSCFDPTDKELYELWAPKQ